MELHTTEEQTLANKIIQNKKELIMKKILLLLMVLGLTIPCANATYSVKYNNAGNPINVSPNFGSNALFTPENRARAAERRRQIEYERMYYEGLSKRHLINVNVNTNTPNNNTNQVETSQPSKENEQVNTDSETKNNTEVKQQTTKAKTKTQPKTYKKDGVTYYN